MKIVIGLLVALGLAVQLAAPAFAEDCEDGYTWDEDTQTCVPSE